MHKYARFLQLQIVAAVSHVCSVERAASCSCHYISSLLLYVYIYIYMTICVQFVVASSHVGSVECAYCCCCCYIMHRIYMYMYIYIFIYIHICIYIYINIYKLWQLFLICVALSVRTLVVVAIFHHRII